MAATIRRDAYGVPHIYSETDAGAIFGAGYAVSTDQTLLINLARYNGVAGLIDLPGVPAIELILGLYNYTPTQQVVDEVTAQQTQAIQAQGAAGQQLLDDIDTYVAGLNARRAEATPDVPPFTRTDVYALNAVKAQFLGQGGGAEIGIAQMLDGLQQKFGAKAGLKTFRDLQARNDPEAAVTTSKKFPGSGDRLTRARAAEERDVRLVLHPPPRQRPVDRASRRPVPTVPRTWHRTS